MYLMNSLTSFFLGWTGNPVSLKLLMMIGDIKEKAKLTQKIVRKLVGKLLNDKTLIATSEAMNPITPPNA